jgi:hypothetical protein
MISLEVTLNSPPEIGQFIYSHFFLLKQKKMIQEKLQNEVKISYEVKMFFIGTLNQITSDVKDNIGMINLTSDCER